jgi:hypothetical protein
MWTLAWKEWVREMPAGDAERVGGEEKEAQA